MRVRFLVSSIALATLVACLQPSCPTGDLPTCPTSGVPSFATDVQPIFSSQCASCHSPGGIEPSRPLDTYGQIFSERAAALDQIYGCTMPQGGALSPADRKTVLTWLVCGAPDN